MATAVFNVNRKVTGDEACDLSCGNNYFFTKFFFTFPITRLNTASLLPETTRLGLHLSRLRLRRRYRAIVPPLPSLQKRQNIIPKHWQAQFEPDISSFDKTPCSRRQGQVRIHLQGKYYLSHPGFAWNRVRRLTQASSTVSEL